MIHRIFSGGSFYFQTNISTHRWISPWDIPGFLRNTQTTDLEKMLLNRHSFSGFPLENPRGMVTLENSGEGFFPFPVCLLELSTAIPDIMFPLPLERTGIYEDVPKSGGSGGLGIGADWIWDAPCFCPGSHACRIADQQQRRMVHALRAGSWYPLRRGIDGTYHNPGQEKMKKPAYSWLFLMAKTMKILINRVIFQFYSCKILDNGV